MADQHKLRQRFCSFCETGTEGLVAGPLDTCICRDCVDACIDRIETAHLPEIMEPLPPRTWCTFCGSHDDSSRVIFRHKEKKVCTDCLELCRQAISDPNFAIVRKLDGICVLIDI